MNWLLRGIWQALFISVLFVGQIVAEDETSYLTTSEGDTLFINFSGGTFQRGDTICLDMTVRGYVNVNSLQFTINWDPSVIQYCEIKDVNPGNQIFELTPATFGAFNADKGNIRYVWFDNEVDGETAPDGFRIARLCFKVIGNPGDKTALAISNIPLKIEAEDPLGNKFCVPILNEPICVGFPDDLYASASTCSTRGNDGILTVKSWGNQTPFSVDIPSIGVMGDQIVNEGDCLVYENLTAGTYNITIRDIMGNDTIIVIDILNADRLTVDTVGLRLPRCAGDSNGRIEINVFGGAEPYYINWSPIPASGQTILRRIPVGIYTVHVEDSMGCTAVDTYDLEKSILKIDTNLIQIASCVGKDDGELEVIPSGGTPFPGGLYEFFWSMNSSEDGRFRTSTNDKLSGKGFVVVVDMTGCRDTLFFDIPSRFDLQIDVQIDSVLCHGDSTGKIQIIANTNGMAATPYFYLLSKLGGGLVIGGSVLNERYRHDSIWAGTFTLSLRDARFCTLLDTFEINEPDLLEVVLVRGDTTAGCGAMNDAFLEVEGFAGTGPSYTYQWDFNNATTARIDNLPEGQYNVTVFDQNMCEAVRTFTITGSSGPSITGFDKQDIGCPGDTSGSAVVLFQPGDTTIFSIEWSNGKTGAEIRSLDQGRYRVTITDNNGCTAIDSVDIDVPMNALTITSSIIDTPSCSGLFDGFLQINVSGGVGPYSFLWNNNSRDSILTKINAGTYVVSVKDQSNCPPLVDTFFIPDPPSIDISLLSTLDVSCDNDTTCDGRAIAMAMGGPDPSRGYIFTWASTEVGFSSPDTASMLCRGDQILIVTNGDCSDTLDIEIMAPATLTVDFDATNIVKPSCFGDGDGSITLVPAGGTGVKTVTWDRGNFMGNTLNNLGAGIYSFVVVDGNGCRYKDSLNVKNPDPLEAEILAAGSSDISCQGETDGRITIIWRGGNPGKANFDWSPTNTIDSVSSELPSGDYQIIVTDSKGCMDTVFQTLTEPPAILADFPISESLDCFGDQLPITVVAANGGNGPDFTYSVNNGSRRALGEEINLFAGTYVIRVFDSKGCSIDSSIVITQPNQFQVDLGPSPIELELGDSLTICYLTNLTGRTVDSIVWMGPGQPDDPTLRCYNIKPLTNTTYSVEIFDEFGCSASDEIKVIVINQGKVFVPNIFMPDGNVNTILTVFTGKGVQSINSMEIYDRWGELVFRKLDLQPGEGWNGRLENTGDFLHTDVYIYVVKVTYKDGTEETRRGDITLFR